MGWSRFFRRSHWDRERAAELESYLQIETDENIARGMSPTDARRAAHMRLGNAARIREEVFHMNTIAVLDSVGRDLRYALRGMRRSPTFSLAVVLTLALGLGANTAIFAVVDGVLIKPLPYPNAEELVSLEHVAPGIKVDDFQMSPTQYVTYREEAASSSTLASGSRAERRSPESATRSRHDCWPSPMACCTRSASSRCSVVSSPKRTTRPPPPASRSALAP